MFSTKADEEAIIMGSELTDFEINFVQQLLKAQFKCIRELESTLLQHKSSSHSKDSIQNRIQMLFCKEHKHWVMATTVTCTQHEVKVYYDSLF